MSIMTLKALETDMIAVTIVAIVTIVDVMAVVQMRKLAIRLHCVDCIMCIVQIVFCRLHYIIVLCELHCADCIMVFNRFGCANKHCNVAKKEELIIRNCMVASSYILCLVMRGYAIPKTNVFVRCLKNHLVELLKK